MLNKNPDQRTVLIVDDEPDIATVTKLGLKSLRYHGTRLEIVTASSGKEAIETMRGNPDIAVILLDVVMETDSAGLDACRAIREELKNTFVRILLRTGQPGAAPEKETIDNYDIDGYLPKAELTTNRLYVSVRTALKAWEELVELDRHRRYLAALHDCMISVHAFDSLESSLERVLQTVVMLCPTELAVLHLETFADKGNPRICSLHLSTNPDPAIADGKAAEAMARLGHDPSIGALLEPGPVEGGYMVPLSLDRELGYGWIYVDDFQPDGLTTRILPMLAASVSNALYAVITHEMLSEREGSIYDLMIV